MLGACGEWWDEVRVWRAVEGADVVGAGCESGGVRCGRGGAGVVGLWGDGGAGGCVHAV